MGKHNAEDFEDTGWQDQYISFNEESNHFVCWDERGEYIDTADTIEEARTIIDNYTNERWRNT